MEIKNINKNTSLTFSPTKKIDKGINDNEININLNKNIDNIFNKINNNDLQKINHKKNYNKITVLNLISTKISKFYQTIRAGDNSIINIEKNYITNNIGKSLVFINPLFLKISECVFENNYDNVIHLKFVKDNNFINDPRKIIIEKNDISYNHNTGLYIDGIENYILNLDIFIMNNEMKRNKIDGIFICDSIVNILLISDNKMIGNQSNGINIYKVYQRFNNQRNTNIIENNDNNNIDINLNINNTINKGYLIDSNFNFLNFIIIKNNEFFENACLGLMINFSNAILFNNSFIGNYSSGMIICNYDFSNAYNKEGNNSNSSKPNDNSNINNGQIISENNSSTKGNTNSLINTFTNNMGISIIIDCTFNRNVGNGLKILSYNNLVYLINSTFSENNEYGLFLENEKENNIIKSDSNAYDKFNNLKNSSKGRKLTWNKNKSSDIKTMDFSEINKWFENIIKITKNTFNKNLNNDVITNKNTNLNQNIINFNIIEFLNNNRNNRFSLDFKSSFSCENFLSIFSDIRKIINENLFNFPKELKDIVLPYIILSNSTIENNSKSGVYLSNCILNTDRNVISENVKFSVYIAKEIFKDLYIENKNRKNSIEGNIGGEWGILETDSFCGNCFNSNSTGTKNKNNNKEKINKDELNKKKKEKSCQIF
jgi:hypothetical protein